MNGTERWQPAVYLKFGRERTQPSVDLASRVELDRVERIVDVGCGPGNSTAVLRARWPCAHVTGMDSSPEMIERARADYPQGEWTVADIREWNGDPGFQVVFSNATLHWIPDHASLIPRLFGLVAPGGVVAAQVPAIHDSPVHQAARRVSESEKWSPVLSGSAETLTYHPESFYYEHLSRHSSRVELWHTIYYHIMGSHQEIIEWYSSSGLKAYLSRLASEAEKARFKQEVLAACRGDYPALPDGKILFPFKRLFMVAYAR